MKSKEIEVINRIDERFEGFFKNEIKINDILEGLPVCTYFALIFEHLADLAYNRPFSHNEVLSLCRKVLMSNNDNEYCIISFLLRFYFKCPRIVYYLINEGIIQYSHIAGYINISYETSVVYFYEFFKNKSKFFDHFVYFNRLDQVSLQAICDNHDLYHQYIDYSFAKESIEFALKFDVYEQLQEYISNPEFDLAKQISSFFETCMGNRDLTMIDFSAFFGSIRCFKLLISNGCEISDRTFRYAIYSGCHEIIHMYPNFNNPNIKSYFSEAIVGKQYEVFEWLKDHLRGDDNIETFPTIKYQLSLPSMKYQNIKVAIIGDKKCGKSTLSGHFLVRNNVMKIERYNWLLNYLRSYKNTEYFYAALSRRYKWELERELSVDIFIKQYVKEGVYIKIIDTPGDPKYMKNTIRGLSDANVIILVVKIGRDNTYMPSEYSLRLLITGFVMGIRNIIVTINVYPYDQEFVESKFSEISTNISKEIMICGYEKSNISIIPVSAQKGNGLLDEQSNFPFYEGITLDSALMNTKKLFEYKEIPLRMMIKEVNKIGGVGIIISCSIGSGFVCVGMDILIMPINIVVKVKSISLGSDNSIQIAFAGQTVGIAIKAGRVLRSQDLKKGYVIGSPLSQPPVNVINFECFIHPFANSIPIHPHYSPVFCFKHQHIQCEILNIDKYKDKWIKCIVRPFFPMSCDPYNAFPFTGSFCIRDQQVLVGYGKVTFINNHI